MPRISGPEATLLAYLAEFPEDGSKFIDRLGPAARRLANVLLGEKTDDSNLIKTAEAIHDWSDRKEVRNVPKR